LQSRKLREVHIRLRFSKQLAYLHEVSVRGLTALAEQRARPALVSPVPRRDGRRSSLDATFSPHCSGIRRSARWRTVSETLD
jgi:hypothetical protein